MKNRFFVNSVVALISILLTYLLLEVGYRLYTRWQLAASYQPFNIVTHNIPMLTFDAQVGYRYLPNLDVEVNIYDGSNQLIRASRYHTNNMGLVSQFDSAVEHPAQVYRIALIGDSYTASTTHNIAWGDTLETLLNADETLKQRLGITAFDVVNFGMDGIGVTQFEQVYTGRVREFTPDLVLVNLISADLWRVPTWWDFVRLQTPNGIYHVVLVCTEPNVTFANERCTLAQGVSLDERSVSNELLDQMRLDLFHATVDSLPWTSGYPHFLARALNERYGLENRLHLNRALIPLYRTPDDALNHSVTALRSVQADDANLLVLYIPMHTEVLTGTTDPLAVQFMQAATDINIVSTLPYFPDVSDEQIASWYLFDGHYNDAGAAVYVNIVYEILRAQLGY
jgi:hypothetical protein